MLYGLTIGVQFGIVIHGHCVFPEADDSKNSKHVRCQTGPQDR